MGSLNALSQVSLLLVALCTAVVAVAAGPGGRCGPDRYWDSSARHCSECTVCAGPGREVTLRPCDATRDAQCGALTDLDIDWAWLKERLHARDDLLSPHGHGLKGVHERINSLSQAEALLRDELHHVAPKQSHADNKDDRITDFGNDYILPEHPRQQQRKKEKKRKKHKKLRQFSDYDDFADFGASGEGSDSFGPVIDDEDLALSWRRSHARAGPQRGHRLPSVAPATTTTPAPRTSSTSSKPSSSSATEDFEVVRGDDGQVTDDGLLTEVEANNDAVLTRQTFSTAETLVWDWQAGVLVAAVCACLLFFVVAAIYYCQHAWSFKRLKKHLDADMEEISARLALMAAMGSDNIDSAASATSTEKCAFSTRTGDTLSTERQQNEYSIATNPRKSRV